jgi:hypothetical protein
MCAMKCSQITNTSKHSLLIPKKGISSSSDYDDSCESPMVKAPFFISRLAAVLPHTEE